MEYKKSRFHVLSRMLFLDVIFNRHTRPVMIYAGIMVGVGASLYHWLEGWSWVDSVYFVVITLTTIGYGDFHPTLPVTKLITIFYGINGIILLLVLFDVVRKLRAQEFKDARNKTEEQHQSTS